MRTARQGCRYLAGRALHSCDTLGLRGLLPCFTCLCITLMRACSHKPVRVPNADAYLTCVCRLESIAVSHKIHRLALSIHNRVLPFQTISACVGRFQNGPAKTVVYPQMPLHLPTKSSAGMSGQHTRHPAEVCQGFVWRSSPLPGGAIERIYAAPGGAAQGRLSTPMVSSQGSLKRWQHKALSGRRAEAERRGFPYSLALCGKKYSVQ